MSSENKEIAELFQSVYDHLYFITFLEKNEMMNIFANTLKEDISKQYEIFLSEQNIYDLKFKYTLTEVENFASNCDELDALSIFYKELVSNYNKLMQKINNCIFYEAFLKHSQDTLNNHKLKIFKWFRDNFINEDEIEHYNEVAPQIVAKINNLDNSEELYEEIYERLIAVCVNLVENEDYNSALDIYKTGLQELENCYLDKEEIRLVRSI